MKNKTALLLLACCACAPALANETAVTKTYPAQGLKTLNIATVAGGIDIDVESGPVRVEITRLDDKTCVFSQELENGELAVRITATPDSGGACRAQVHVIMPNASAEPTLKTVSGFIDVSGISGRADVTSTSGDIIMRSGAGLTAKNISGDITVNGVRGPINAATVSGALKIYSGADITARSSSGGIYLSYAQGRADLTTESGSITGSLACPARVETVSGAVDLDWTAAPLSGEIAVKSVSGSVGIDFPTGTKVAFYRETVTGTITGQKNLIDMTAPLKLTINTISGDIDLGYN